MNPEQELLQLADQIRKAYQPLTTEAIAEAMRLRMEAARETGKSWSGSNIGYHANVYYQGFVAPPPGAHFSSEWGLEDHWPIVATQGDWREYNRDAVLSMLTEKAGGSDLNQALSISEDVWAKLIEAKDLTLSFFEAHPVGSDKFLAELRTTIEEVERVTVGELAQRSLPSQVMTRDSLAMGQGFRSAPHQHVIFEVLAVQSVIDAGKTLESACRKAAAHIARGRTAEARKDRIGTNVFIGHGRAPAWRELKDFISDRLELPPDEFNRVPVAGITNIARLSEMLDAAAIALVVLTAEDEQKDGSMNARMNVIHEVGLFQGRLGFTKAIVLLEEGCEEFSNIQGLGQIRFPAGKISACFEEVRKVLEREGLLE